MKRFTPVIIILLALAACTLGACFKQQERLVFALSAAYDSSVTTGNIVNVSAKKTGGDDDIINLVVEGLPDYIAADFVQPSRQLPWTVPVNFHFNNVFAEQNISNWKSYTVIIKGTTSAGVVMKSTVTFTCYPQEPGVAFDGISFLNLQPCSAPGGGISTLYTSSSGGNGIILRSFFRTLTDLYDVPATVNGRTLTLTIPPYTAGYYTIKGNGTFYPTGYDSLGCTIHYSISTVSTHDSCTCTLFMAP